MILLRNITGINANNKAINISNASTVVGGWKGTSIWTIGGIKYQADADMVTIATMANRIKTEQNNSIVILDVQWFECE